MFACSVACEPILPLVMTFWPVSIALRYGVWLLAAGVLLKCFVFALLQKRMTFANAVVAMFVANIVSSVFGALAAFPLAVPMVGWFGLMLIMGVSWPAARRYATLFRREGAAFPIVLIVVVGYVVSAVLLGFSQAAALDHQPVAFWVLKFAYVEVAIVISIGLTTFWEEYVVWWFASDDESDRALVVPVFRANAVMLGLLMLVGAIAVLPERLRSPDFLIAILRNL
jgi:hypothetical protein